MNRKCCIMAHGPHIYTPEKKLKHFFQDCCTFFEIKTTSFQVDSSHTMEVQEQLR